MKHVKTFLESLEPVFDDIDDWKIVVKAIKRGIESEHYYCKVYDRELFEILSKSSDKILFRLIYKAFYPKYVGEIFNVMTGRNYRVWTEKLDKDPEYNYSGKKHNYFVKDVEDFRSEFKNLISIINKSENTKKYYNYYGKRISIPNDIQKKQSKTEWSWW